MPLTKMNTRNVYGGVTVQLHASLKWTLDGEGVSTSSSSHFTPERSAPGTHFIGG